MLESHVVVFDYDGEESTRIVVTRVNLSRNIELTLKTKDGEIELTCDGYELMRAIRAAL